MAIRTCSRNGLDGPRSCVPQWLATWSLIFFGGHYALRLPFAAIGLLVTVELYVMATWWFDAPSVARGMGVGMILGGLVFLTVFVLVVQSLGAG